MAYLIHGVELGSLGQSPPPLDPDAAKTPSLTDRFLTALTEGAEGAARGITQTLTNKPAPPPQQSSLGYAVPVLALGAVAAAAIYGVVKKKKRS